MACKTSFEFHHQFPKLAEESGFTFNTHRPRIHLDWNKIRLIDVDSLIRERKFILIEQHLNDILDCVLESEFDVRILDEGVLKMFRLAQLAVEYQQFCRHYLDRSVHILRQEITSLATELESCKRDVREKDDEIRRLKKRSRHSMKTPLPYSNDNIAAMILKTLNHKNDFGIPSTSNENLQYNKCNYCDKVFLNQLYLKSHITRRHVNILEMPQKDNPESEPPKENAKLSTEIAELKNKLKDMEVLISKTSQSQNNFSTVTPAKMENTEEVVASKKETMDIGVSTNNEDYLLNKIEEWKKEEQANYNKEIDKLRNQIMEKINTLKEADTTKPINNQNTLIEDLRKTIQQQGIEILALKQELTNTTIRTEKSNAERNKDAEAQIAYWAKRAEDQSQQYDQLLQKLNDVAKDAKESRALAEAETQRASKLQALLEQSIKNKTNKGINRSTETTISNHNQISSDKKKVGNQDNNDTNNFYHVGDKTLEMLQRKAQELLSIKSSSSSSDISSIDRVHPLTNAFDIDVKVDREQFVKSEEQTSNHISNKAKTKKLPKKKESKSKQERSKSQVKSVKDKHSPICTPGSPVKIVRAKITEEVNNRLVAAGVDPLKSGLPRNMFQKKRSQLQKQLELKSKKNPEHEKTRHSILAHLDISTTDLRKKDIPPPDYISPNKATKPFHNLSSMISNVKTKALSLVKLNDTNVKTRKKSLDAEVAKRAMSLLKTPPGSAQSSPVIMKRSPMKNSNPTYDSHNNPNMKATVHDIKYSSTKEQSKPRLQNSSITRQVQIINDNNTDDQSDDSEGYYKAAPQTSKSIENLIKSPARRPSSAHADYNTHKYAVEHDILSRTQSATNLTDRAAVSNNLVKNPPKKQESNSDDSRYLSDSPPKKTARDEKAKNIVKQTKSVLKNASSTSSLNKKKVLFDMDAIQMKSVSASPSQSTTEKSEGNEKYELGLVNLDGEEWDISSIENEPLKNDTKIQNVTHNRAGPKIAELKAKIESQLARRNETPTLALAGKVDVLTGSAVKASSIGGSNTSLGSSILDDSESVPVVNHKAFVNPKKIVVKDDSDIDISEFSIDGIANKNESF